MHDTKEEAVKEARKVANDDSVRPSKLTIYPKPPYTEDKIKRHEYD